MAKADAHRGRTLAVAIAAGALVGCPLTQVNQNLGRTCFGNQCLTYTTWGANIDAIIDKQAVGYAYAILDHGLLVASNAFGEARTQADPPKSAMSLDGVSNAASVNKAMTATAALKLLAAKHVPVGSKMSAYLPSRWSLGKGVKDITFAELMTHASGIRDPNNHGKSFAGLQAILAQDIATADKVYDYENANFALFRILIPYLNGFNESGVQDIGAATDSRYQSYLRSVFVNGPPVTCKPATQPLPVLSYQTASGSGTDWGDWTDLCGGGGLQLSVNQMGTFMAYLMTGVFLPTTSSDPNTTTLPGMVSKMYGWDYNYPADHGNCVVKNGDLGTGNPFVPYLSTLYVYCPDTGLALVALANSTLPFQTPHSYGYSGALDDIVYKAYTQSWQAK
jgi:CubicO group peptidase (beta-lactamase class C family)